MVLSYIYVSTKTALSSTGSHRILQEGSFVSVRVINRSGPQSYTVSFAGSQYSVRSDRQLEPGKSFRAAVTFRNGKIVLVPDGASTAESPLVQNFQSPPSALSPVPVSDARLAAYLSSLGIFPDSLSYRLVQQLQQMGVRFDTNLLTKVRQIASRFPGHEVEAAEIALVLEEKGIESSVETITALLFGESDEMSPNDNASQNLAPDNKKDLHSSDITTLVFEVRKYIDEIFSGHVQRNTGLLTLFNHLSFFHRHEESASMHWFILPFELSFNVVGHRRVGTGVMRFFTDLRKKECQKVILDMQINRQKCFFVLYFNRNGKKCSKVRFFIHPVSEKSRQLVETLRVFLRTVSDSSLAVEWMDLNEYSPFFTENIPLVSVEGQV